MTRYASSMALDGLPRAAVTVDLVVLTVRDDALQVVLVRRGVPPFQGRLALPGGFVLADEGLTRAAARELEEEAGLRDVHVEQLGTYGDPARDPRGRVVSVAYLALVPDPGEPVGGGDAASAAWHPAESSTPRRLAFDHAGILQAGIERARAKLEYTPLATAFCAPAFTVAQLRRVYEVVWGVELDARNFHRKVTSTPGFLVPTGDVATGRAGRPAARFRRGDARLLNPPMLRPGTWP